MRVFRAAHDLWKKSIKEYQCVDVSERMNDTAEFLLRGGGLSNFMQLSTFKLYFDFYSEHSKLYFC